MNIPGKISFIMCLVLLIVLPAGNIFAQSTEQKIENFKQRIEKYQKSGDLNNEVEYCSKLAFLYWQNGELDKSLNYFNRSLEINKKLDNRNGSKLIYYYLGMIYSEKEEYQKSVKAFKKGIKISRELGMQKSILSGLINLAQTYQNNNEYEKSNEYALKAYNMAQEQDNLEQVRSCAGLLTENYKELSKPEKSAHYFEIFSSLDKRIKEEKVSEIKKESQDQVNQALSEKEKTKKELSEEKGKLRMAEDSLARAEQMTREQQMRIEMQDLELKRKEAQIKLEKTIRNTLIIGVVLIIGVAMLLYKFYRQKQRANLKLAEQNEKINKQNQQIHEQKNKLEIQNTKLSDSIAYAQNIQSAILPTDLFTNPEIKPFILYKPKDIVSGDFYWYARKNTGDNTKQIFIAAVDCTGHGVPGAFMSMIGNQSLNEIIVEKNISDPSEILYNLNMNIIDALNQEYSDNTDGMDVCLVRLDFSETSKDVYFAGAKRPLYYIKKGETEIKRIKGNRYSIGGVYKNKREKTFETHDMSIQSGDILYLTTDGIIDQVNENRKRFSSTRLLSILQNNLDKPMEKQEKILEKRVDDFRGDSEQRDDITVIGIKIL